jgi:hypothetical protein
MVARVATFEGIDVETARRITPEAESIVRPMMERLAGYRGYLDLLGTNGKALAIVFFDTEENAEAAEQIFDEEMPKALGELMSQWEGRRTSVERYDVQADSRP